jgi:hypothetical protein
MFIGGALLSLSQRPWDAGDEKPISYYVGSLCEIVGVTSMAMQLAEPTDDYIETSRLIMSKGRHDNDVAKIEHQLVDSGLYAEYTPQAQPEITEPSSQNEQKPETEESQETPEDNFEIPQDLINEPGEPAIEEEPGASLSHVNTSAIV